VLGLLKTSFDHFCLDILYSKEANHWLKHITFITHVYRCNRTSLLYIISYLDVRSGHEISVCINGDNVYNPGYIFISTDCTTRCTCLSGYLGCEELCPLSDITCKPGEMKKQWSEQIPDSKCSCPRLKCVKKADGNDFMFYSGTDYSRSIYQGF
jgi:hypothetical protein